MYFVCAEVSYSVHKHRVRVFYVKTINAIGVTSKYIIKTDQISIVCGKPAEKYFWRAGYFPSPPMADPWFNANEKTTGRDKARGSCWHFRKFEIVPNGNCSPIDLRIDESRTDTAFGTRCIQSFTLSSCKFLLRATRIACARALVRERTQTTWLIFYNFLPPASVTTRSIFRDSTPYSCHVIRHKYGFKSFFANEKI